MNREVKRVKGGDIRGEKVTVVKWVISYGIAPILNT